MIKFCFRLLFFISVSLVTQNVAAQTTAYADSLRSTLITKFKKLEPGKFGTFIPGIETHIVTERKIVALTFDACGGRNGSNYDTMLIAFLKKEKIPVTLFITGTWIDKNESVFKTLCAEPLFEIESHGSAHRPCSITPQSKYGLKATGSVAAAIDEIELNALRIERYTNQKPTLYRPAAAVADEGCVAIASAVNEKIVTYDVLSGDAVAGVPTDVIKNNLIKQTKPGSIVIMHMNHPEWNGYEALVEAIPVLRKQGYEFVKLEGLQLAGKK